MPLIASFPWYPFDEIKEQYDIFWGLLRDALLEKKIDAPEKLSPPENFRIHWASSRDLLLSQCCGYHIATKAQQLEVIGAPDFMLDNLSPGEYRSIIITRKSQKGNALEDFLGCRAAFNEDQSFSGHTALLRALPLNLVQPNVFKMEPSDSHQLSMQAVADGKADVAAIDEISFRLITNERPDLKKKLRIISYTENVAAPPYVTSSNRPAEEIDVIRDTLVSVSRTEEAKSALKSMYIRTIIDATNEDYLLLAKKIKQVENAAGI